MGGGGVEKQNRGLGHTSENKDRIGTRRGVGGERVGAQNQKFGYGKKVVSTKRKEGWSPGVTTRGYLGMGPPQSPKRREANESGKGRAV